MGVRLRQSLRLLVPVPVEPRRCLRVALSNSKKTLIVRDELYIYIYNSLYRKIKIVQRQAYSTTSYRYSLYSVSVQTRDTKVFKPLLCSLLSFPSVSLATICMSASPCVCDT